MIDFHVRVPVIFQQLHTREVPLQLVMQLFHSPQVEPLLVHLAERLENPLDDPFATEIVVVPSGDMARYLKRELSRSLGARIGNDGIVSNVKFV